MKTLPLSVAAVAAAALAAALVAAAAGCGADPVSVVPDGAGAPPDAAGPDAIVIPDRPAYGEWIKVEPPGVVCGNGSQYKFWVWYSDTSNDVVVGFEPGGACWDYESCTGQDGIRGAANVNGLPDDHWELAPVVEPFFQPDFEDNATRDWNFVYVPYCNGDVHTGNRDVTYQDPDGVLPDVEFHHHGHDAVQSVIAYMTGNFTHVPRMLVTGCSAGGVGALVNYYFLRTQLPGVERAYLLSDSGPIFPNSTYSKPLHDKVREAWNVESILDLLPEQFDRSDFGNINTFLADRFPDDRLAVTFFRRDYNFSLYSYERFWDYPPKDQIMEMWWDDTQKLMAQFDTRDNLAYYIPYWRNINDSHCTTVITFSGSEIQEADMTLNKFVDQLLEDGTPLQSYLESPQPGEDE